MAYKQAQNRKKRLMRTYNQTKHSTRGGVWFDEDTGRYIKYAASNTPGYSKTLRRVSNRKLRHSDITYRNSTYKKVYDYWWILY